MDVVEQSYVNSAGEQGAEVAFEKRAVTLRPLFEKPRDAEVEVGLGGHGGGDPVLLNDSFSKNVGENRFGQVADHIDGAKEYFNRDLRK